MKLTRTLSFSIFGGTLGFLMGVTVAFGTDSGPLPLKTGVRYTNSYMKKYGNHKPAKDAEGETVEYHGGPVLSNAKVVEVLWGVGIDSDVVQKMASFYTALTASTYYNWLTEYNTVGIPSVDGGPGTNQVIGRSSFVGAFPITPGVSGKKVSDDQVQSELESQISAGKLPAPDANTVYMIDFPKGLTISMSGMNSCQDYCAYHNSFRTQSKDVVMYGVLPDSSDPICLSDCGPGTTDFEVITTDASHELGEAITDPDVDNSQGHLAWNLSDGSEIGDPEACVHDVANIKGVDGTPFQVQSLWSGVRNSCVFGP